MNQKTASFWSLAVAPILFCGSFLYLLLRFTPTLNDYLATSWALSYRYGFLSRALPGTLLDLAIRGQISTRQVTTALTLLYAVGFAAFLAAILKLWFQSRSAKVLLYLCFIILNPFTVKWALAEFGRLDFLALIVSLAALAFSRRSILPILLAAVVCVLSHESYLVSYFPFFATLFMAREGFSRRSRWQAAAWAAATVATTLVVVYYGQPEIPSYQFLTLVRDRVGFPINERMIMMQYYWNYSDHLRLVLEKLSTHRQDLAWIPLFVPLVGHFVHYWITFSRTRNCRWAILLALSTLSPLLLSAIGIDIWRWFATCMTLNFTAVLYLAWTGIMPLDQWLDRLINRRTLAFVLVFFLFYALLNAPGEVYLYETADLF